MEQTNTIKSRPNHSDTLINGTSKPSPSHPTTSSSTTTTTKHSDLTALQQHILFFDKDNDGIIYPSDIYTSFRQLGFNIPYSLASLLIPIFFSYPTTLAHTQSWLPDPYLRIYIPAIHAAMHGSDTSVFDIDGHFHSDRFDALFDRWDVSGSGGLSATEMWDMWKGNRRAADPAGAAFAFMEMMTTWLLLQREGRVWKDDLRACYDGSIFWTICERERERREGREKGAGKANCVGWDQGYGVRDLLNGLWRGWTWRTWELKES